MIAQTNYFGNWEIEGLEKEVEYDITIERPGYRTIAVTARTDADHYVGEFVLESVSDSA